MHILYKEDRWFEKGVMEVICAHLEHSTLNRGGELRHSLGRYGCLILIANRLHAEDTVYFVTTKHKVK